MDMRSSKFSEDEVIGFLTWMSLTLREYWSKPIWTSVPLKVSLAQSSSLTSQTRCHLTHDELVGPDLFIFS